MSRTNELYPPIRDMGAIGDGHSAALLDRDAAIVWLCLPHFDDPAVLCRLLDARQGGAWSLAPPGEHDSRRAYEPGTNVLVTRFTTAQGEVRLTDFMPAGAARTAETPRICRMVEGLAGAVELGLCFRPTFFYGAVPALLSRRGRNAVSAAAKGAGCVLTATFALQVEGAEARATVTVREGERHVAALWDKEEAGPLGADAAERLRQQTVTHWRNWIDQLTFDGPHRDLVLRSALTLKMLVFEPTGALIAAPTTSLPERAGGVANWDYRHAWLRDCALAVEVLQRLGRRDESERFFDWVRTLRFGRRIQPVYTILGDTELPERILDHLEGYRGSAPVRIGNAAAGQVQLDSAGHILDAAWRCHHRMPRPVEPEFWEFLVELAERVVRHWEEPDRSIWETRKGPRQFLHSKLYAWVALDRAVQFCVTMGLRGNLSSWQRERGRIATAILERGFSPRLGGFTAVLDEDVVDATPLVLPLVGFLPAHDPRMIATRRLIRSRLERDRLIYRNTTLASGENEGAFLLCTFWLVENLALARELDEAELVFEHAIGYVNDLGLLAEEAVPYSRELLGNMPQGFSHLGLIRAALHIAEARRASADDGDRQAVSPGENER